MTFVDLLDLATFSPSERYAPEPVPQGPRSIDGEDDDDDGWDAETADETPESLEALILAARDEVPARDEIESA
jgi:hypothetical protein